MFRSTIDSISTSMAQLESLQLRKLRLIFSTGFQTPIPGMFVSCNYFLASLETYIKQGDNLIQYH